MGSKPLLLIHARGDDQIPAEWSEELYERAVEPRKLILLPGGHHRSAQHDAELPRHRAAMARAKARARLGEQRDQEHRAGPGQGDRKRLANRQVVRRGQQVGGGRVDEQPGEEPERHREHRLRHGDGEHRKAPSTGATASATRKRRERCSGWSCAVR